jgi:hypothetical protein
MHYTAAEPAVLTWARGESATGAGSLGSDNEATGSWMSAVQFAWLIRVCTPELAPEADELRPWAALARRSGQRWMEENDY